MYFIDLDLKRLSKVEDYYELDKKIVNCYRQIIKMDQGRNEETGLKASNAAYWDLIGSIVFFSYFMSMLGLSDSPVYVFVLVFLLFFLVHLVFVASWNMISYENNFFLQNIFSVSILHGVRWFEKLVCYYDKFSHHCL